MRRRIYNSVVFVSLMLLIALGVLWAKSHTRGYSVGVSRFDWPSAEACISRHLSVRIVFGHCLILWSRSEYDLTQPDVTRHHHAMDLPAFRERFPGGMGWSAMTYDLPLGPQAPIVLPDGRTMMPATITREGYLFQVPRRYGFGVRNDPPRSYVGRAEVDRYAVAPAWPIALVLTLLPARWALGAARRHQRARSGRCPACGYDLRATPHQCPECGAATNA